MISLLVFLVVMILIPVALDGFFSARSGDTIRGTRIISGLITIAILFSVIMTFMGSSQSGGFVSDGIPFVPMMDSETTILSIFRSDLRTFVAETAELMSLILIISYLDRIWRFDTADNRHTSLSLIIISRLLLVLTGIVVNCFLVSLAKENQIYQTILTCLQCMLAGTAIVLTPTMLIGQIFGVSPENPVLSYIMQELPNTAIGTAVRNAVSRSAVLLFGVMLYESQYGPLSGLVEKGISLAYSVAMIAGVVIILSYLLTRAISR